MMHGVFVLIAVSILSFLLLHLAPGEFFSEIRLNPQISSASVDALRAQYGLDRSLPAQYGIWLRSSLKGDFGYSFAYNQPVSAILWPRVRNTLLLNTVALGLAWFLALLLGAWAAARPGGWEDRLSAIGASTFLVIPDLLIAVALLMVAVRTRWFPAGGMIGLELSGATTSLQIRNLAVHLFLPVLTIVLGTFPMLYRHVRSSVAEALASPFVRAARGHGLGRSQILFGQALPAAANPLITLLGMSFGTLLSASLIVEVVFSWPGLGPILLESILARDVYVIVGVVVLSAALVIVGNLFADMLLYWNDPRIRTERH
jgi:ABC-type dipeptide/oligopeptide/nickel transport system permease component